MLKIKRPPQKPNTNSGAKSAPKNAKTQRAFGKINDMRNIVDDTDPNRGLFQKSVLKTHPPSYNMTAEEMAAAMAILNPGHGTNTANAGPIPDESAGRVYMFRSTWEETVNVVAGDGTSVTFATLPFFECPFAYAKAAHPTEWYGFSSPYTRAAGNNPGNFLYANKVYAFRCVGKSATITNSTPTLYIGGKCIVGRKTADVDCSTRTFQLGVETDGYNERIVQSLPFSSSEISSLAGTTNSWQADEGAYLISHHEDYNWRERTDPSVKAYHTDTIDATYINTSLHMSSVSAPATSVPLKQHVAPTLRCLCSKEDGMDIALAHFYGLPSASYTQTFTVKFCVSYELRLKANSPLAINTVDRPIQNSRFFDYIRQFENLVRVGGYPESYNFWDKLWAGFKKLWKSGGGDLAQKGLNMILPGLGGSVASLIDTLAQL